MKGADKSADTWLKLDASPSEGSLPEMQSVIEESQYYNQDNPDFGRKWVILLKW